jgi:hypothetical protein
LRDTIVWEEGLDLQMKFEKTVPPTALLQSRASDAKKSRDRNHAVGLKDIARKRLWSLEIIYAADVGI